MRSHPNPASFSDDVIKRISSKARDTYDDQYAATYRESDRAGLSDWTHASWCERVRDISSSFGKPIDVLDLGCGTGRYFHCLQNVRSLVGVDISAPMLKIARENPISQNAITADQIQLIEGDIGFASFTPRSFDFVYSIGVFGDFLPLSVSFLERMRSWLKDDGVMFFTVMESRPQSRRGWKERLAILLYPMLPHRIKVYIDIQTRDYLIGRDELERLLSRVGFKTFEIHRQVQNRTFLCVKAQR